MAPVAVGALLLGSATLAVALDAPTNLRIDDGSGGGSNNDEYVHGKYITRANTGWRALGLTEADLRPHNGKFTQPGVYEGLDITGSIRISANNVTIRGFRARSNGSTYGIAYEPTWHSGYENTVIEYGELDGGPTAKSYGVLLHGSDHTVRRMYVHRWRTGLGVRGSGLFENNYVNDLIYQPGSHNTSSSIRGSGARMRGNNLNEGNSVALAVYADSASGLQNIVLVDNYWQTPNAIYAVNFGMTGRKPGAPLVKAMTVINNVWGQDFSPFGGTRATHWGWTSRPGNVWRNNRREDGTPVGTPTP